MRRNYVRRVLCLPSRVAHYLVWILPDCHGIVASWSCLGSSRGLSSCILCGLSVCAVLATQAPVFNFSSRLHSTRRQKKRQPPQISTHSQSGLINCYGLSLVTPWQVGEAVPLDASRDDWHRERSKTRSRRTAWFAQINRRVCRSSNHGCCLDMTRRLRCHDYPEGSTRESELLG